MSIKLISKHRTCLMAIAMLWIGCYHLYYGTDIKLFNFLIYRQGYFGVDIFVFVSGFGIYQSLKKNNNYIQFIIKRIKRIFPYCIPIYIISGIIFKENIVLVLMDCLGLSIFFRNSLVYWFTSFIFVVYVLSPLYHRIFEKKPLIVTICSILLIFIICLMVHSFDFVYIYFRICVYLLGFYFGYLYYENKDLNRIQSFILIIISFIGFLIIYLLNHYYRNDIIYVYPSILVIPGLLLILSFIIDKVSFLQKILNWIGVYTYQFYLLHKIVLDYMTNNLYGTLFKPGIHFDFLFNHSTIIITFIMALVYKKMIDFIINKCSSIFINVKQAKME